MYYVYVLLLVNGKLYTGSSGNLKQRITYHEEGKVRSTKMYRPIRLVYYEVYLFKKDALVREKYLKTGNGRKDVKKQLKHTYKELKIGSNGQKAIKKLD